MKNVRYGKKTRDKSQAEAADDRKRRRSLIDDDHDFAEAVSGFYFSMSISRLVQ